MDVLDDREVHREGISRPSPLLTSAVTVLRAEEMSGRRPWEVWLDPAAHGLPPQFARPGGADAPSDPSRRPGWPKVHYGHIGSADKSLRSAAFRDAVAAKHDLLAVEMEGQGIGNGAFLGGREWFVIRGVSDHGDSATGQAWRQPAALAAAAFTRALLCYTDVIPPRTPVSGGQGSRTRSTDGGAGQPGWGQHSSVHLDAGHDQIVNGPVVGGNYYG